MIDGTWVVMGGSDVLIRIAAILGAVGMAIFGYFPLHEDLRTRGGQRLTNREKWEHILGLLAYFVLGAVVFGGVTFVAIQLVAHV